MKRNWLYSIKDDKILLFPVLGGTKEHISFLQITPPPKEPDSRVRRSPKRHTRLRKYQLERLVSLSYIRYEIETCQDLYFSDTDFRETFRILGVLYL